MTWVYRARDGEMQTAMRFSKRVAATYAEGKKTESAKFTMANLTPDKLERAFLVSRMSEIAVCHFLNIHIIHSLDWGYACDRGWDLEYKNVFIDVKASEAREPRLIWPASKNTFLEEANCDVFCLCEVNFPFIRLHGFCSLKRFIAECHTSNGKDGLILNTKWMSIEQLTPAQAFLHLADGCDA